MGESCSRFTRSLTLWTNPNVAVRTHGKSDATCIEGPLGVGTTRIVLIRRTESASIKRNADSSHLHMMQLATRRSSGGPVNHLWRRTAGCHGEDYDQRNDTPHRPNIKGMQITLRCAPSHLHSFNVRRFHGFGCGV